MRTVRGYNEKETECDKISRKTKIKRKISRYRKCKDIQQDD